MRIYIYEDTVYDTLSECKPISPNNGFYNILKKKKKSLTETYL